MQMLLDHVPPLWLLLVAFPAVTLAYAIFAMAGFGAVFITAPALAQFMPVSSVVPVLSLVDCGAASINGVTLSKKVALDEMKWLIPMMMIGSYVGTQILLLVPPRPMMAGLGVFVTLYALRALFVTPSTAPIRRLWVVPIGGIGGIFSGMFGSGGFIYAIYLTRRLADKDAIRATQSVLIILSTLTRAVIFLVSGVYSDWHILGLALACVPAMLLGTWIGHRVTLRMSRETFLRSIHALLLVSGSALVLRAWLNG
jgi:uncharacterized membrane protein YfcA